ncbi:MAG: hypothetical protein ACYTKD_16420, partial [Planctomycetota bacterium]
RVVLYREDFEDGAGGWEGEVVPDPTRKSAVLNLVPSPENRHVAVRTNRYLGDKGFRASIRSRVSFAYRTEGALSSVMCQNWYAPPEAKGANHYINLPPSTEWARADLPIHWMRTHGEERVDLSRGFRIRGLGVYADRPGQTGKCFIDDFEVYGFARSERRPGPRPGPRPRSRDR